MDIQEVATSEGHRHKAFAERVLEDDLAWWACFLFQFEILIKNRGGSVRPRVEFSERQARIEDWCAEMSAKFEAGEEEEGEIRKKKKEKLPTVHHKETHPDQVVPVSTEFGMDEDFFNVLANDDDLDFFL